MACPGTYASLPCSLTGVAYLSQAVRPNDTTYQLMNGHASQLPDLDAGQYFFATLTDACNNCCITVRVVDVDHTDDRVTVERVGGDCDCLSSNSRLRYDACGTEAVRAIAAEAAPAAQWPIVYDCESHTYRIDCQGIKDMVNGPCGG